MTYQLHIYHPGIARYKGGPDEQLISMIILIQCGGKSESDATPESSVGNIMPEVANVAVLSIFKEYHKSDNTLVVKLSSKYNHDQIFVSSWKYLRTVQ